MDTQAILPKNLEERLAWHAIRSTYALYFLGALYVVAPVLGWTLLAVALARAWRTGRINPELARGRLPLAVGLWAGGMLVMLLALLVGHMDFELGVAQSIKSSIGWAKGWALLGIFPLIGCLEVRPAVIYRASSIVCLHTLVLAPVFVGAWLFAAPSTPYVSPLQAVGGPGPEFFAVSLYEIDPGSGRPRWRLFTPWAPALGFVANIFFVFALHDADRRWRAIGMMGSVVMVLMSGSRLALLALPTVWLTCWLASRLRNSATPFLAAAATTLAGLFAVPLIEAFGRFRETFRAARADSSRVRETLGRMALDRWADEAPVWGHGVVERGPHLVEFMPIGSHHSWFGLLFVKGVVGLLALAVPLFYGLAQLTWWSGRLPQARAGLGVALLLLLYTFGENLEILAYLIWPGLVAMGAAHRDISLAQAASSTHSAISRGDSDHA